jgi:hypothetical protein
MKKYILLTLVYTIYSACSYGQDFKVQRVQKNSEYLAKKMAKKLQDSLKLTNEEYFAIYESNIKIQQKKINAMALKMSRDSIGMQLQKIERSRDSIYGKILPITKLKSYIDNKRYYINNGELKK